MAKKDVLTVDPTSFLEQYRDRRTAVERLFDLKILEFIETDIDQTEARIRAVLDEIQTLLPGINERAIVERFGLKNLFIQYLWPFLISLEAIEQARKKLWKDLDFRPSVLGKLVRLPKADSRNPDQEITDILERYRTTLDGLLTSLIWYKESIEKLASGLDTLE